MNKIILPLLFLTFLVFKSYTQVTIAKTEVDYSLKTDQDSIIRILTFGKEKNSAIYTSVKYTITNFNQSKKNFRLKDETSTIQKFWDIAEDSIHFELTSLNMGYPQQYQDVLKSHIQAFIDSEDWQAHLKQHGKKLNYQIIQKVMLETNIYKPLNDFLKTKGYFISGFDTEKHGFVTKENLQKAGFSGNEIVPMPYMVWLSLSKY